MKRRSSCVFARRSSDIVKSFNKQNCSNTIGRLFGGQEPGRQSGPGEACTWSALICIQRSAGGIQTHAFVYLDGD